MGGMGSGGHNIKLRRAEQFRHLDAAALQRQGILRSRASGAAHWTLANGDKAQIAIEGGADEIVLEYKAKANNANDWQHIREAFAVNWCARHFGGAQAYLLCCKYGRRVRFLYLANLRFRCRSCHRLVHASSQERSGDRATRKNQKLRRWIGAPLGLGDFVIRPKGMHQATYDQYLKRIACAEQEVWDDAARLLKRLKGEDPHLISLLRDNSFWS